MKGEHLFCEFYYLVGFQLQQTENPSENGLNDTTAISSPRRFNSMTQHHPSGPGFRQLHILPPLMHTLSVKAAWCMQLALYLEAVLREHSYLVLL